MIPVIKQILIYLIPDICRDSSVTIWQKEMKDLEQGRICQVLYGRFLCSSSGMNMNNISTEEKQKHIVMYIGSLQKGGAEHVMVNLAEYFYLAGYRVTMVTTYLARQEYPVKHGTWKIDPKGQAVLFPD